MKKALFAYALFALVAGSTSALAACYEYRAQPGSIRCGSNDSNSADFASGCSSTAPTVVKVEVACPPPPPPPPPAPVDTWADSCRRGKVCGSGNSSDGKGVW